MTELKTYLVAVRSTNYHLVQAANVAYANKIALAQKPAGYDVEVVKTQDVTEQWEGDRRTWTQ